MNFKGLLIAVFFAAGCVAANAQIDHTSHSADGTKYGFVDKNDKWVVAAQWDNASWDAAMQVGIVGNFKEPKGAINAKGEFILPVKYSKIRTNPQSQTLLVAEERDGVTYWGIFTKEGKPLIPLEFKAVLFDRSKDVFECTTTGDMKKYFGRNGDEVAE